MLIHSASQLITLSGGVQRGESLGSLNIIDNGAVLLENGLIKEIGPSSQLLEKYPDEKQLDAQNHVVMPGFVDPHTHLVWAGDRAEEFSQRLEGKSYMEILASGGGILSTVNATRQASLDELTSQSRARAISAMRLGTTTLEAKSGYALDTKGELRLLQVLMELDSELPLDIIPTFLGAHAVPSEFKDKTDEYTTLIIEDSLPELQRWWKESYPQRPLPYVDVFCEPSVFNYRQSKTILEKARHLGFPLKIHADEFDNIGGASLAAELGAVSADHLVKTSDEDIKQLADMGTVAVSLPCTPFGLAESEYTPAKKIIAANGILTLASDLNPGTAWCGNMQFVIALACRYMKLSPAQAIAAATINAAAAVERQAQVGSLEIGKQADLIILSVADYRQLGYRFGENLVDTVIKKGKFVEFS